jgi:hypothetical protein
MQDARMLAGSRYAEKLLRENPSPRLAEANTGGPAIAGSGIAQFFGALAGLGLLLLITIRAGDGRTKHKLFWFGVAVAGVVLMIVPLAEELRWFL